MDCFAALGDTVVADRIKRCGSDTVPKAKQKNNPIEWKGNSLAGVSYEVNAVG